MENPIETSGLNRSAAQGRRLWYVLGAGGLFLVILGGLVVFQNLHRRGQAVAEILRLGGTVNLAHSDWAVSLPDFIGDEVVTGNHLVAIVDFSGIPITDADTIHIAGLKDLLSLTLSGTQVTDAGLVHLKGLTQLQYLDLCDTQVTDAGLVHLKGLTKLSSLDLSNTPVTDAGLVQFKGLTYLQTLILSDTQVTDVGLVRLKALTKLQTLDLDNTQVTDAGLVHLQAVLPDCYIQTHQDVPLITVE